MLDYFHFDIANILGVLLTLAFPCLLGMFFAALYQKSVHHKRLWFALWLLPLVVVLALRVANGFIGNLLIEVPLFVPLYLSFGVSGRTFKLKSAKHWIAIGGLVLGTALLSSMNYDAVDLFLPVIVGVVLAYYFRIAKNKPLKILWFVLWGMLLSFILFRHALHGYIFSYEYLLQVGAPFLLFSLLVYFCKFGKKFCLIFCPALVVALILADVWINRVIYAPKFGAVVDSKLTPAMMEKARGEISFEMALFRTDAWLKNTQLALLQVRGDSTYICRMADPCYLGEDDRDSCQWLPADSAETAQIFQLKNAVESYQWETANNIVFDGEIFEIALYDYVRGTKRELEIGNAFLAEVPKAAALNKMAYKLLPPRISNDSVECPVNDTPLYDGIIEDTTAR